MLDCPNQFSQETSFNTRCNVWAERVGHRCDRPGGRRLLHRGPRAGGPLPSGGSAAGPPGSPVYRSQADRPPGR
jgi:hypothetical protein